MHVQTCLAQVSGLAGGWAGGWQAGGRRVAGGQDKWKKTLHKKHVEFKVPMCYYNQACKRKTYESMPRDVAQLGSAIASGVIGRRFKSCRPDQTKTPDIDPVFFILLFVFSFVHQSLLFRPVSAFACFLFCRSSASARLLRTLLIPSGSPFKSFKETVLQHL